MAAGDVVARPVVDAAVGDALRPVDPPGFEAVGELVGQADQAYEAALADDGVAAARPAGELLVARGAGIGRFLARAREGEQLVRAQAAAYAEIAADYAEHLEACGGDRRRYSDVARCAKGRWLTRERMAAAKAAAVERHIAHLEPEDVRRSIARQCTAGTLYIARQPYVAGEHPNDIVARRVGTCADGHVAAYAALRRFAGRTHAGAVDDCIGRFIPRYGWPTVARCLRDAARDAGDAAFAPCLGNRRSVEDLVDCPGVPER